MSVTNGLDTGVAVHEVREGLDFCHPFSVFFEKIVNTCSRTTYGAVRPADEGVDRYGMGYPGATGLGTARL